MIVFSLPLFLAIYSHNYIAHIVYSTCFSIFLALLFLYLDSVAHSKKDNHLFISEKLHVAATLPIYPTMNVQCVTLLPIRVDKIKLSLNLLHTLQDSQAQTILLRSCLALPKVVSVLRACPPIHIKAASHNFDCSIRTSLESILVDPLSDWSWQKASLPCSLSLRSASIHAPAAFLDSSLRTAPLTEGLLNRPLLPQLYLTI